MNLYNNWIHGISLHLEFGILFDFYICILCIFIRISKDFKLALLQRAMECLIQHRPNKRAIRQYRHTKLYINILSCGYLFVMVSEIIHSISEISVRMLFFGNCYFPPIYWHFHIYTMCYLLYRFLLFGFFFFH